MPYDGDVTRFEPVVVPFDFATARPDGRLLELARNLEAPTLWAGNLIEWDFSTVRSTIDHSCGTAGCAIGLSDILWPEANFGAHGGKWSGDAVMAAFELSEWELIDLFTSSFADDRDIPMSAVTPGMVAAAIRTFVANRQSAS